MLLDLPHLALGGYMGFLGGLSRESFQSEYGSVMGLSDGILHHFLPVFIPYLPGGLRFIEPHRLFLRSRRVMVGEVSNVFFLFQFIVLGKDEWSVELLLVQFRETQPGMGSGLLSRINSDVEIPSPSFLPVDGSGFPDIFIADLLLQLRGNAENPRSSSLYPLGDSLGLGGPSHRGSPAAKGFDPFYFTYFFDKHRYCPNRSFLFP